MKVSKNLVGLLVGLAVACVGACSKEEAAASRPSESSRGPATINVFAAASLREACDEIGEAWETAHPGDKVVFNFGASNALAQQIVASQKADVFLSADAASLDVVRNAGLVETVGREGWLSNQLVVVVPSSRGDVKIASAADLARPEFKRLSLANPEAVPAGKYAKAWLESKGVWKDVAARVVPGVDVRAALAAVESEGADVGVVYSTDAAISNRVRVALRVQTAEAPRIEYQIASIRGDCHYRDPLVEFFMGDEAKKVFERRGFLVGAMH